MHNRVKESCEKSLKDLRVSYLDLYLVHWPFPNYHAPGCDGDSRNPDSRPFSVTEFLNTWRQCEALVEEGRVKYIGMSNMTVPKLQAVLPLCRIQPMFLEMELHPGFQQPQLYDYALSQGIQPIGYCPIGSPSRPERDRDGRGYSRYPDAGDYGDCGASSRTSCYDLPEVGGTERTDSDSFFSKGISICG